jgi:hypothetical protein
MPATISPVGMGDVKLRGSVLSINLYAEPSGWRKANVKEYKALVSIDNPPAELRSGMTASVTIHCDQVNDALVAPVQSVYAHGGKFYAFVYSGNKWEARPIECGPTNDKFWVIEKGLNDGDRIALNPRGYLDRVALPKLPAERRQTNEATVVLPPKSTISVAKEEAPSGKTAGAATAEKPTTTAPAAG